MIYQGKRRQGKEAPFPLPSVSIFPNTMGYWWLYKNPLFEYRRGISAKYGLLRIIKQISLLPRHVTSEQKGLGPVESDENTVPSCRIASDNEKATQGGRVLTAKAHAQIGATPEEVCQSSTACNVAGPPTDVGDSTLFSNVSKTSLVRVLEWPDLLDSAQLSLALTDLTEGGVPVLFALCLGLNIRQPL